MSAQEQVNWGLDYIKRIYGNTPVSCTYPSAITSISDAGILRTAAHVLRKGKQTFVMRVIIRILELHAEHLEPPTHQ